MSLLRRELELNRMQIGWNQRVTCSRKESKEFDKLRKEKLPLPDGVFEDNSEFYTTYYRIDKSDLSADEMKELITYRQLNHIGTIKSILFFFLVVFLIGIVLGLMGLFGGR